MFLTKKDNENIKVEKLNKVIIKFLKSKKYKILNKNFKCEFGNIDFICEYDNTIIFVIIKLVSEYKVGSERDFLNYYNIRALISSSQFYMKFYVAENKKMRYDLIEVDNKLTINHLEAIL